MSDDAEDADPVRDYYAEKKKRYLKKLREGTPDMTTGTLHDWEDAAGYAQPHDARSDAEDEA